MKAATFERYGPPEVLGVREVEKPVPLADQVLVKVHATSVNAGDWHKVRGRPLLARPSQGWTSPKIPIPGWDVAGTIEAVGRNVKAYAVGDAVYGQTIRTFAEYVRVSEAAIAPKPPTLSYEEAAAVPVAALTALQGLRDKGGLSRGQRVLIVGAAGGCGMFGVQIAKVLGAHVTASTRAQNIEFVRSLGADRVIEHAQISQGAERYDVVLDMGGYLPLRSMWRVLTPNGRLVQVGAGKKSTLGLLGRIAYGRLLSRGEGRKAIFFVTKRSQSDLVYLTELLEAGAIRSVIDRCYPLDQAGEAVRYVDEERARGKVVIKVV